MTEEHNRHVLDWDKIDRLLRAGCNGMQVAAAIGMHHDTLYRRTQQEKGTSFTVYMAEKKSEGDSMLLDKQFNKAVTNEDNTMLVWLGKTRLGQSETHILDMKKATSLDEITQSEKSQWAFSAKENLESEPDA